MINILKVMKGLLRMTTFLLTNGVSMEKSSSKDCLLEESGFPVVALLVKQGFAEKVKICEECYFLYLTITGTLNA